MYRPRGFSPAELGDIEVIEHDGRLHLFHLVLPAHDRVAHLVSDDGLAWQRLPDALTTGEPGAFDDDQIWTMGVVAFAGRYHMLYTALSVADDGRVQRVGHAVSDDLLHWTKTEGAVGTADDPRLEGLDGGAPWVSFRDPKPTRVGDRIVTTVCVRAAECPARRRGAIAFFDSDDPQRLGTLRELVVPGRPYELECPQCFEVAGRWYLTAAVHDDRSQRYFIGEGPTGPWRVPEHDRLLPAGHYAARVFTFRGETAVLGWFRDAAGRGSLLAPAVLHAQADGALVVRRWPGWDPRRGESSELHPLREDAPGAITRMWSGPDPGASFELSVVVQPAAPRWGVALERDADGGALVIELTRKTGELRLVDERCTPDAQGRPWFSHTVIQTGHHRAAPTHTLTIRRWADAIEVELDELIVLSAIAPTRHGPFGLFADSGALTITSVRLTSLTSPTSR